MVREILCHKDNSSTAVAVQDELDTVEENQIEENQDYDPISMSDDALDSSFTTVENDDLVLDARVDSDTSMQDKTSSYVSCKTCNKRKNQIRKLKRTQRKLEQDLKSRNDQIEALKLEKRNVQSKHNKVRTQG